MCRSEASLPPGPLSPLLLMSGQTERGPSPTSPPPPILHHRDQPPGSTQRGGGASREKKAIQTSVTRGNKASSFSGASFGAIVEATPTWCSRDNLTAIEYVIAGEGFAVSMATFDPHWEEQAPVWNRDGVSSPRPRSAVQGGGRKPVPETGIQPEDGPGSIQLCVPV